MDKAVSRSTRADARPTPRVERRANIPLLDLSELRVIVIDDNEFATILMKRLLGVMRVTQVTSCLESTAADDAIRESKADLAIVDINIPSETLKKTAASGTRNKYPLISSSMGGE